MGINKEILFDLYSNQLKTAKEIAEIFGYKSSQSIYNLLKKFNIPRRSSVEAQVKKIKIEKSLLFDYYITKNTPLSEICKYFKCSDSTIYRYLKIFDIPRKDKTRNFSGWNKGLTKEIDERVRKYSKSGSVTRKELFKTKKIVHHNLNKQQPLTVRQKISDSLKGRFIAENNTQWKGGNNSKYKLWRRRIQDGLEYRELRKIIFARDSYHCQLCNKKSNGDIEMHHIRQVHLYPNLIFENTNCITLCHKCHSSIRGKERQLENFFYEKIQNHYK